MAQLSPWGQELDQSASWPNNELSSESETMASKHLVPGLFPYAPPICIESFAELLE